MKLLLERVANRPTYCIGHLYAMDGDRKVFICDTLEDTSRRLQSSMSEAELLRIKVPEETAIPTGRYKVTMAVRSPAFSKKPYYMNTCNGYVPRLIGVKGFSGVLIHRVATADDTAGCIGVGYNKQVGRLMNSAEAFEKLLDVYLKPAEKRREAVEVEIVERFV